MGKTWSICTGGKWVPPLEELYCTEGVALIFGGQESAQSAYVGQQGLELFGPGGFSIMFDQLGFHTTNHKAFYAEGYFVLCGGNGLLEKCFKIELTRNRKKKGRLLKKN